MSAFVSNLVVLGKVVIGQVLAGRFDLTSDGLKKGIRKIDTGCTCGGKSRISVTKDNNGFSFRSVPSRRDAGKKGVVRNIVVEMNDRTRVIVGFKYDLA